MYHCELEHTAYLILKDRKLSYRVTVDTLSRNSVMSSRGTMEIILIKKVKKKSKAIPVTVREGP
jgi:hypothetical protein